MIEEVTGMPWVADYVTEYVGKMLGINTSISLQLVPYLEVGVTVCAAIILIQIRSKAIELETENENKDSNDETAA